MYFIALATDYDGTLAEDGVVADKTVAALRSFRQSGRKLILVTGRELPDLRRVFSHLDLFDAAVVENGAVLVDPATGDEVPLGEDKSFYFRGPDAALNLRAQNLAIFPQIAEGIDDRTWLHHLRAGDYSQWLRDKIKDGELADDVARIEGDEALTPLESRQRIKEAIESRYTSPA
jgi:hypothetical protein